MADGTVNRVRKILSVVPGALRVMTDDGISKLPLSSLHPQSLAAVNSMMETPEEAQARQQREAAAAQTYRENKAIKDRLVAEENAMVGANQRAEEARQAAARQAAAEAREKQFQQMMEMQKQQDAQREARRERLAAEERERARAEERARQYNLDAAAVQALQGLSDAAQLEVLRKMGYVK